MVCAVAAFAAVVSYSHIYGMGRARGREGRRTTVGADTAFGAGYEVLRALISAWPAVAFIGSVEIAMQQVRRARVPCAATCGSAVPQVPGDVGQAGRAAYSASVAAGQPLSQRVMAERFGLSDELAGEIEQNDSYLAHVGVG